MRHPAPAPGTDGHHVLAAAQRLRSTTVEVDLDQLPDLVALGGSTQGTLWHDDGEVLLGLGEALRVPLDQGLATQAGPRLVTEALSAMSVDDPLGLAGTGPVAMGALPYDPAEPGFVAVHRLVIGRREGRGWATLTGTSKTVDVGAVLGQTPKTHPPE